MDFADGSLQRQYENYRKRLEMIKTVGLHKEVAERELTDVLNNLSIIFSLMCGQLMF